MIALSPGIADGCFELLRMADAHPMSFQHMRAELPRIGSIDVDRISQITQDLGWLRANDSGVAVLAPGGARILSISLAHLRLRQALLDYVETFRPPWLKNAMDGRLKTLSFAPTEIGQSLVEAELATCYDDDVVNFWDRLASLARGLRGGELSAIGREGERLTIAYEHERTGKPPKWRAIESNSDGYDVLSIVAQDDTRLLPIEVKATTIGLHGSIHLTRNEWESGALMPTHCFHLWDLSQRAFPRLAVVSREYVTMHVPFDAGQGTWREVEVPFRAFSTWFKT